MSSDARVYEIAINHSDDTRQSAEALRRRLAHAGIRAVLTGRPTTQDLNASVAAPAARRSLCLVSASAARSQRAHDLRECFDFVLVTPMADQGRAPWDDGMASVLGALTSNGHEPPIGGESLRRATQASYNAIATQFADVWFDALPGEAIDRFLHYLPRGARILDAGCGPGHHARYFRKAGFRPIGLDFSRGMLDIAIRKNEHIPFVLGDILDLEFPPGHVDAIWSAIAINHIPREALPRAVANLVGALKPRGVIGLNFQIGRPSEIISFGQDQRFFEYPAEATCIVRLLGSLGVRVLETHHGSTTRNIHGLPLELCFATVVGRYEGRA